MTSPTPGAPPSDRGGVAACVDCRQPIDPSDWDGWWLIYNPTLPAGPLCNDCHERAEPWHPAR